MTTTQRNEAPMVLHILTSSYAIPHAKVLHLALFFLAYIPERICEHSPLFLAILAIFFLFHISLPRSSCYSVCQQSFQSFSNHPIQQYQFFYHLLIHHARIQISTFLFSFFFSFSRLIPFPFSSPYSSLHVNFTLFPGTL